MTPYQIAPLSTYRPNAGDHTGWDREARVPDAETLMELMQDEIALLHATSDTAWDSTRRKKAGLDPDVDDLSAAQNKAHLCNTRGWRRTLMNGQSSITPCEHLANTLVQTR